MNADPIERLIHELARLPGIGRKSATRLAYHLLRSPNGSALKLAEAIQTAREEVKLCHLCGNLSPLDPCRYCTDERRDARTLCVVEELPDFLAIEATGDYRGRYHILQGVISPLNGVGPDDLRIAELLERVRHEAFSEVILATNPTVDGETTALYLGKLLRSETLRISRLASGIPAGSDLEYLDRVTISRALSGRRELP